MRKRTDEFPECCSTLDTDGLHGVNCLKPLTLQEREKILKSGSVVLAVDPSVAVTNKEVAPPFVDHGGNQ